MALPSKRIHAMRLPFRVQPKWLSYTPATKTTPEVHEHEYLVLNRNTDRPVKRFTTEKDADEYCEKLNAKAIRKGGSQDTIYGEPVVAHKRRGDHKEYDPNNKVLHYDSTPNETRILRYLASEPGATMTVNYHRGGWRSNHEPIATMLKKGYVVMKRQQRLGVRNRYSYITITPAGRERLTRIKS